MNLRDVQSDNTSITYTLKKSFRARHLRLRISSKGAVTVTIPRFLRESVAENFVRTKAAWIIKHQARCRQVLAKQIPEAETRRRYRDSKQKAEQTAQSRLAFFNTHYQFSYGKVSVRNQKQRWGSCSPTNNLSFNYRIALLPTHLTDYIIVHELCHTKAHHHRPSFWKLVAEAIPDYQACRRALRTEHRISYY